MTAKDVSDLIKKNLGSPWNENTYRDVFHAGDPNVEVIARHQLTPELAEPISQADFVMFVDAREGKTPGALSCEPVEPVTDGAAPSTHHMTPSALLTWAKELFGRSPEAMAISIVGESFEFGTALSEPVCAAMPQLLTCVTVGCTYGDGCHA